MRYKNKLILSYLLSFILFVNILVIASNASSPNQESLLLDELPYVITPTKVAQPVMESPSTITVLTKEDIRRYGNMSLSDILRNVPGVDVMSVSPTDSNVSMRGFNGLVAGRILTLINNRPIYVDFYGVTLWELLPFSIEEIERIEIIRGPGSALYGADAFDGIINIITNSNLASIGTKLVANVGQFGKLGGTIIQGGGIKNLTYNASLGRSEMNGWEKNKSNTGEVRRFNGELQYAIDDKSSINLSGGTKYELGDLLIFSGFNPLEHKGTTSYIKMDYSRSNLKGLISWNRRDINAKSIKNKSSDQKLMDPNHAIVPAGGDIMSCFKCHASWRNNPLKMGIKELSSVHVNDDTVYTELQNSFNILDKNLVTWGLDYQFNRVDSKLFDSIYTQNLAAGYIQDQLKLLKVITLTGGLRYDRHPLTGNSFSERISAVYNPTKEQAFRLSLGRAFRNPSYLASYLSLNYNMVTPISRIPIKIKAIGNKELSPEWITSHEFGYQGVFGNRLKGSVDVFFNTIKGLIDYGVAEYYAPNALFPGSPGKLIPSVVSLFNSYDARANGGELTADLSITDWLSAYSNYSYQYVKDTKTGKKIESAPQNKLNSGLSVKLGKTFSGSLYTNYVDKTVWDDIKIDPYTLINSTISFRALDNDIEIILSIFNLLNNKHREYPQGDMIGRSILLSLIYKIN